MTREEFKDAVLNILLNQKFGNLGVLFNAEDINLYKVVQCDMYDEDEWYVYGDIPLDEFLDELYDDMMRQKRNE